MPDKLTFKEYYTWPLPRLTKHPDFNANVLRIVESITAMSTKQLENVRLMKGR